MASTRRGDRYRRYALSKASQLMMMMIMNDTGNHNNNMMMKVMKLNDDAVRVAVSLRLGCSICLAHTCRCRATVDVQGQHGLICKQAPSRIVRHNVMNDIIFRSLSSAGIPASKEPIGLARLDGKRPHGLTLVPWQGGKPVTWDITVVVCRLSEGDQVFLSPRVFFLCQSRSNE